MDYNTIHFSDMIVTNESKSISFNDQSCRTLDTEILVGHDLYRDRNGISSLGELVIRPQKNKVVVGGVNYLLASAFNATPPFQTETLNNKLSVGTGAVASTINSSKVCLFNLGIGGCGNAYDDIKKENDYQNVIDTMIPFRVMDSGISPQDESRGTGDNIGPYFFKKTMVVPSTNVTKDYYYLKEFELNKTNVPDVRIVTTWKGTDGGTGSTIISDPGENPPSSTTANITSYVEMIMRVSTEDLREYFSLNNSSSTARFNTMGLCWGTKSKMADGSIEYTDVHQFSVLNFSHEMLHFEKDLMIIYRVYIA